MSLGQHTYHGMIGTYVMKLINYLLVIEIFLTIYIYIGLQIKIHIMHILYLHNISFL